MIDNSRQGYMTPETKDLYRQGTPVLMKDGQTISQPWFVGWMINNLDIQPWDRVKEIGSGTCRALSQILQLVWPDWFVTWVERNKAMFDLWKENIQKNFWWLPSNLELIHGDGLAHQGQGLYNKVMMSAAFSPQQQDRRALSKQLVPWAQVLYPHFTHRVGSSYFCHLLLSTKDWANNRHSENLGACNFVPLVSEGRGPDGKAE